MVSQNVDVFFLRMMKLIIQKNYPQTACQNTMLKLYTSCMDWFLQDHCEINKITTEQADGKKDVRGGLEQIMINKMILDEVIKYKRSVVMVLVLKTISTLV